MDTKSTSIVGLIILGVLIIGGVLWYMSEHPAPVTIDHQGMGTSTPSGETSAPQKIDEHGKYYDITASIPSKTPIASSNKNAQAVEVMHQFALSSVSAFKERGNFDNLTQQDIDTLFAGGRKESLDMSYQAKMGTHTVSYVFRMVEDTFGAHPNSYFRTFTFDTKTGTGLQLSDVFAPGTDYLSTLSKLSRQKLPAILAERASIDVSAVDTDYMNRGTTPDQDNFQNWYIEGTDLVLLFPPYQVGAYAYGVSEVRLPFATLPGVNAAFK